MIYAREPIAACKSDVKISIGRYEYYNTSRRSTYIRRDKGGLNIETQHITYIYTHAHYPHIIAGIKNNKNKTIV